jgi:hypothetical protein
MCRDDNAAVALLPNHRWLLHEQQAMCTPFCNQSYIRKLPQGIYGTEGQPDAYLKL